MQRNRTSNNISKQKAPSPEKFAGEFYQHLRKNVYLLTILFQKIETEKHFLTHSMRLRSVQLLSRVRLFATPWIAARQTSLSITNSRNSPKPMSIESVMPSNHLILCCPLFLLPSIFPSIRVFSNESAVCIRWPKIWSFSFQHQSFQWTPRTDLL